MADEFKQYTLEDLANRISELESNIFPISGGTVVREGTLSSPNFVKGQKGWQLDSDGTMRAVNADLSGTITAVSGTIGGFTIAATSLSATSGGNTVTLATTANALIAGPTGSPTVVITQAGVATLSNVIISGSGSTFNGSLVTNVQERAEALFTTVIGLGTYNDGATVVTTGTGAVTRNFLSTTLYSGASSTNYGILYSPAFGVKSNIGAVSVVYDFGVSLDFTCRLIIDGSTAAADDKRGFWGMIDGTAGPFVNTTGADPAPVTRHVAFYRKENGDLVASMSNGTTNEQSAAITGVTLTQYNTYRIVWTTAVSAKFYVNDVLKATLTTQLPTAGAPRAYFESANGNGGGNNTYMVISNGYKVLSSTV